MRYFVLLLVFAIVIGCTPSEEEVPVDDPIVVPEVEEASFAGTWSVDAMTMDSDSVLVTTTMFATDNAEGWTIAFDHVDEPVPAESVTMAGDSVTVVYGAYPSALRDGAMVTSLTSVVSVSGDEMTGRFRATYDTGEPLEFDGRLHGSRSN